MQNVKNVSEKKKNTWTSSGQSKERKPLYKEKRGDMFFDYLSPEIGYVITTNSYVKNDGSLVMGRGTALRAAQLHKDIPKILGDLIMLHGNVPFILPYNLISLPVKWHWRDQADIALIQDSLIQLRYLLRMYPYDVVRIPRPGCGNGKLEWPFVQQNTHHLFNLIVTETGAEVEVWSHE